MSAYTTGENLCIAEEKEVERIGPLAETKRENNPADPPLPATATKPTARKPSG